MIKSTLYLPGKKSITVDLDEKTRILPNFTVEEIANNKAKDDIKLVVGNSRAWTLLCMLQLTRYRFGPMTINSAYRTVSYNKTLPGASANSAHLKLWAFDWSWPNMTNSQRTTVRQWWKDLCEDNEQVGAINYYTWGVHCEIGSDVLYGQKGFATRNYL